MKEVYDKYLESHFLSMNVPTKEAFESTSRSYSKWYKKFLPYNKNTRILDVGCGMGHFLYFLRSEGYTNFYGIDISKQQIDFVKKNITKSVEVTDAFEFLKKNDIPFQVIVLNDFLEHIPKERILKLLHLVHDSLEKGGKVFIKSDNMSNPFGLRGRYMDITHEIGFTEHSLKEVLMTVGFKNIIIFGAEVPLISLKSKIIKIARVITHKFLKLLFLVQGYPPPKILHKDIIGIALRQ